jgi:phosphatidate cytidylyltransferase
MRPGAANDDTMINGGLEPLRAEHTGSRTTRSRESRRADAEKAAEGRKSRAGRNLPAAIGVGVLLAAIVLGSLFLWRPAFVAVLAVGAAVGVWEMSRALADAGRAHPPVVPLIGGCLVMPGLAWYGGVDSLALGLLLTVLAATLWRLSGGVAGFQRDMTAATLIAVYVPFLISFGVLLARPDDGELRVLAVLACVVFSDTGGYVAGVFFGKHPMAPKASPKKSWEGLAGSLIATAITGALFVYYLLDQPWWHGAVVGVGISAAAVLGDLCESILKRDLGVKDMSNLLPGHGGLMDRLDSVVFAAPAAFVLLNALAPAGS